MSISESASQESAGTARSGGAPQSADRVPDRERQDMIVRQNCVGNAVAYCGSTADLETVIGVAQVFENYVHTGEYVKPEVDDDDEALKVVEDSGEAAPTRRTRRSAEVE
jgi:hypothetical protein